MERCPTCGSELVRREGLLSIWYCAVGCGACFRDLNLAGAAARLARRGDEATPARRATTERATDA